MDELFRFISVERGPIVDRTGIRDLLPYVASLPHVGANAKVADRPALANAFIQSKLFVRRSDALFEAVLRLAAEVRPKQALTRARLDELSVAFLNRKVDDLPKAAQYKEFRARLYGSLRACRWHRPTDTPGYPEIVVAARVVALLDACFEGHADVPELLRAPWLQLLTFGDTHPGQGRPMAVARPLPINSDIRARLADVEHQLGQTIDRKQQMERAAKQLMPQLVADEPVLDPDRRTVATLAQRIIGRKPADSLDDLRQALGVTWADAEDVEQDISSLALAAAALRSQRRQLIKTLAKQPVVQSVAQSAPQPQHAGEPGTPLTVGTAKVLGRGRLMLVTDTVVGYEPGAIAKIVNIPASATKSTKTSMKVRTDDISETEDSQSTATERTLESDERFSLKTESHREIELEMAAKAAGSFSGSYGPVSAEGSAEASTSFGMRSATDSASDYAKGVTERASEKLASERRKLARRSRTVEIDDTLKEGFDNTTGGNVTAIYQWVNEVHEGKLMKYSARLMLEFTVPEPGAVMLWAEQLGASSGDQPQPPDAFDVKLDDLEPGGIDDLLERFGVTDVPAPPKEWQFISKVFKVGDSTQGASDTRTNMILAEESLVIPEGYSVSRFWVAFSASRVRDKALDPANTDSLKDARYLIRIGRHAYSVGGERNIVFFREHQPGQRIRPRTGVLPVTILGVEDRAAAVTVVVGVDATPELIFQWKLEVFGALQQAYQRQLADYQDQLRASRLRASPAMTTRNPEQWRSLERDEIKRSVLTILTGQQFQAFGAISPTGSLEIPQVDIAENAVEGPYITFFETSIEWTQVQFILYPYFWTDPRAQWLPALQLRNDDPQHERFLKAGSARVTVPVRQGFEAAILSYLSTTEYPLIWNGVDYADIDMESDMYYPVWRALMEEQGQLEEEPIQEGKPWYFVVPTNHQIISAGGLPAPPAQGDDD